MYRLDTSELLVAEVVALRAALKRLVVELAMDREDPNAYLSAAFEQAARDVGESVGAEPDEDRAEAIAAHAQEILREIYTVTLAIE